MSGTKRPGKRPYQRNGYTTVTNALKSVANQEQWLMEQGPLGEALREIRESLIVA